MITKVEIESFQSHKKSILEFTPGTNIIIGESDAGKSAIFRAINWVCSNRPLGDAFCSEWGGTTRVVLHTSEGNVIERIRSKSINSYVINGKILEAFGHDAPPEVMQILQMDFANIQAQMDAPFLLASSPGEAARLLNKAAAIDDIDYTVAALNKTYNRLNNDIKYDSKQLAEYNEQIKQYDDLPELENKIDVLEKQYATYEKQLEDHEEILYKIEQIQEAQEALELSAGIEELLQKTKSVQSIITKYDIQQTKLIDIQDILQKTKEAQETLISMQHIDKTTALLNGLQKQYQVYEKQQKEYKEISDMVYIMNKEGIKLDKLQKQIKLKQEEFAALAPNICPLCGNKIEIGAICDGKAV